MTSHSLVKPSHLVQQRMTACSKYTASPAAHHILAV